MATSLKDKRVRYSMTKDVSKEGVVQGDVLMKESKDTGIVSGYCILHDDGSIAHIAYWRLTHVMNGQTWKEEPKKIGDLFNNNSNNAGSPGNMTKDDLPF